MPLSIPLHHDDSLRVFYEILIDRRDDEVNDSPSSAAVSIMGIRQDSGPILRVLVNRVVSAYEEEEG